MTITFNIDKSQRKSLAHRIGKLMGAEVRYCGVPSCAYQIGSMMLGKNAVLIGEADKNVLRTLLNALNDEGYQFFTDSPQNAQESVCGEDIAVQAEPMGYASEDETAEDDTVVTDVSIASADESNSETVEDEITHLTISMPRSFFTDQALDNLRRIISNKSTLIKHALCTDSLEIVATDDKIEFPWFTLTEEGDSAAYMQFIPMLCEFAKVRKRVVAKTASSDNGSTDGSDYNEKYAFRCFLLRLGMIGEEYKAARKVLLRNLTGSSAFRSGKPESSENLNQSEEGAQDENTISE